MNLYRMTYVRAGGVRGTTFAGKDAEWAHSFAASWCSSIHATLLTVKELRPLVLHEQMPLELRA